MSAFDDCEMSSEPRLWYPFHRLGPSNRLSLLSHKVSTGEASWSYRLKRFVGKHELLVSEALGAALRPRSHIQHFSVDFITDLVHAGFQPQDFARIDVHVIAHAIVSFGIGADFYDG